MTNKIIGLILVFFVSLNVFAQNQNLPKIMVIPFTKDGEDLRTVLDENILSRIAITKIKEGFDTRGYTTVDFVGRLKAAKDNQVFNLNNQTDLKAKILELSGSDIYVVAEVSSNSDQSGSSATVIISSYETATGNSLSNKVSNSGKFQTNDIDKLVSRAVEKSMEDFVFTVNEKFSDMLRNGRSVFVDFSFSEDSEYTMTSEIGKDAEAFSDVLEEWIANNSLNNNYHIQGVTDLKMIFDEVKIPLKDKNAMNYTSTKFALELFRFLKTLNLEVNREVKGSTIYMTIN